MKVNIEIDMTPEEARKTMGLPDVSGMQAHIMADMEERMRKAMDTSDPEAMMRAWMPMGGVGLEQFQKFLWESARAVASGSTGKKDPARSR